MKLKKVKAFTLSEMLVVLLLTVIVVGLAFSVLGLVQKQMSITRGNYQNNTSLNRLKQVLWYDFRAHQNISFHPNEQKLTLSNELHEVIYQFSEKYIIREKDTFEVALPLKTFYFDGLEVDTGIIDAIELHMDKAMMPDKGIFVYRDNAATIYMND